MAHIFLRHKNKSHFLFIYESLLIIFNTQILFVELWVEFFLNLSVFEIEKVKEIIKIEVTSAFSTVPFLTLFNQLAKQKKKSSLLVRLISEFKLFLFQKNRGLYRQTDVLLYFVIDIKYLPLQIQVQMLLFVEWLPPVHRVPMQSDMGQ